MKGAIFLICLALGCVSSVSSTNMDASSSSRQLLNNDKLPQSVSDTPPCPALIPVTTTAIPGVEPQLVIGTNPNKATRNFTCIGDLPSAYSDYLATLSDAGGNWWGQLYYDVNGFPTFSFVWQNPFEDYKQYPRTITTFKEFVEIPSPDGGAPWARYKVFKDTGNPPFAYVERANTVGGAPPGDCGNKEAAQVPYSAQYNFYMCREEAAKPVAAPVVPSPFLPSPVVAVVASPPLSVVPIAVPPVAVAPTTPVPVPAPVEQPSPAPVPEVPVIVSPAAVSPPPSSGGFTIDRVWTSVMASALCAMLAMI